MKKTKGFTLVELLIALAIIGIMSSVVFVFSVQNKTKAEVFGVADEVAGRINDARQRSLTGDVGTANKACGMGAYFPNTGGYKIFYQRSGGACSGTYSGATPEIFSWSNSSRVRVSVLNSPKTVFFQAPFGAVSGVPLAISVQSTSGGVIKYVCVSDGGVAEVKDSCP